MKKLLLVTSLLAGIPLQAEVITDGTVGASLTLQGPHYAIKATLGQQRGAHLFHSFEQFNLDAGESATFSGPTTVNNIISRVTGGLPSSIDGTLRSTIPNANLYFLNPYGLLLGPNATLDTTGSVHLTTADTLIFSDSSQFSAKNPSTSALTAAPISAFGFIDTPQPISLTNSQLNLLEERTFSFIGGRIDIEGGGIVVPSGRINIASLAEAGEVAITALEDLPVSVATEDLTVRYSAIDVTGEGNNGVYIRAGQFLLENTTVKADTEGVEDAGRIDVQATTLIATNRGRFRSDTKGAGQGGTIKIQVAGLTEFSGEIIDEEGNVDTSGISAISRKIGGNGGNIEMTTGTLTLERGGFITTATYGQGQSGNIAIHATDAITLAGVDSESRGSFISARTYGLIENAGVGGMIDLSSKHVQLLDGAYISTSARTGAGGEIHIYASDELILAGENENDITKITTATRGQGQGGTVRLEANQLSLLQGAFILADTRDEGTGGDIIIQSDSLTMEGVDSTGYGGLIGARTMSEETEAGNGGNIMVSTNLLKLTDGAQFVTTTFGPGQGGNLTLKAQTLLFTGHDQSEDRFRSGIVTTSEGEMATAGPAGSIDLVVDTLQLVDMAELNANTFGPGYGGNIHIQAQDINLLDHSEITAESEGAGEAGKIALQAEQLHMHDHSIVATSAKTAGGGNITIANQHLVQVVESQIKTSVHSGVEDGGNITITKPTFIILDRGHLEAQADAGRGGNITLDSDYNITTTDSVISASSKVGIDGEVVVTALDEHISNSLVAISTDFLARDRLETFCRQLASPEAQVGHLEITLPVIGTSLSPEDWQPSHLF